jgi:hypothetical protein
LSHRLATKSRRTQRHLAIFVAVAVIATGLAVAAAPIVNADPPDDITDSGGKLTAAAAVADVAELELTSQAGKASDKADTTGNEGADQAMDKTVYTKYLTGNATTWLQYELETAAAANRYILSSADDAPDRDPRNWTLRASTDGRSWKSLDNRTNQTFPRRHQARSFSFTNTTSYRFYRFDITANNGSSQTQLAELQLFGSGADNPGPVPPTPTTVEAKAVSPDQVIVTWDDNSRWETEYRIERTGGGSTWSKTVPAGTTRFPDLGLAADTTYSYRVSARNATGSSEGSAAITAVTDGDVPPSTWQEHWETEHTELLTRTYFDDDVAVYVDKDVTGQAWTYEYVARLWRYTKKTYGKFSNERLYVVLHQGKLGGGHAVTTFDAAHDYRNVIDVGLDGWSETDNEARDVLSHEIAHIVEDSAGGAYLSPAFGLWLDSKWAEIFQYDAYLGAGLTADAERWYTAMTALRTDKPRDGTAWFKDWFYPLWRDHGKSDVLAAYFAKVSTNFPQYNSKYSRDMNWGEFVHFWSGAAGTDLKPLATKAFGWPDEWQTQLQQAKQDFPGVTYASS